MQTIPATVIVRAVGLMAVIGPSTETTFVGVVAWANTVAPDIIPCTRHTTPNAADHNFFIAHFPCKISPNFNRKVLQSLAGPSRQMASRMTRHSTPLARTKRKTYATSERQRGGEFSQHVQNRQDPKTVIRTLFPDLNIPLPGNIKCRFVDSPVHRKRNAVGNPAAGQSAFRYPAKLFPFLPKTASVYVAVAFSQPSETSTVQPPQQF